MSDELSDLIAYMGDVQFIDNTGAEAKRERGKAYEIVRRAYATGKAAGAAAEKAQAVALIEAEAQRRELNGDDPDVLAALNDLLEKVNEA